MRKLSEILILLTCLIAVLVSGCGAVAMKSVKPAADDPSNSINPFDFGDEFSQSAIRNNDADDYDTGKNASKKGTQDTGTTMPVLRSTTKDETDQSKVKKNWQDRDNLLIPNSKKTVSSKEYRIQIGTFEKKDDADKMVVLAQSKTDLPVEIEYIAPFYRVRAGNFTEKSEAEEYVKFFKNEGFKDARWVTNIKTQY